jgi:hypothetical protein
MIVDIGRANRNIYFWGGALNIPQVVGGVFFFRSCRSAGNLGRSDLGSDRSRSNSQKGRLFPHDRNVSFAVASAITLADIQAGKHRVPILVRSLALLFVCHHCGEFDI